ncbi:MAG: AI-2E family transporter [Actinobacteria bacterium]|nr:MAG: AI-2E family transporter [Actinomycetota bacterium]
MAMKQVLNVRRARDPCRVVPERLVRFPVRTILTVLGTIIAVAVVLEVIIIARHVIVWILISLFLALAMNPAVEFFQRHGIQRRGLASGVTFLLVLAAFAGIGALLVPTLVTQVSDLVGKVPDYVHNISQGKGRFGFLETKYHLPERIRDAIQKGGAARVLGLTGTALSITKSVISIVLGTITIAFLTFFMLLEGPKWMERFYGLLSPDSRPRWENVSKQIYRTVGGYVTGNLLISLIAGGSTTIVLIIMGVPYAVALGLVVAILDLIPLAGATIAAILIGTVAFIHSIVAGIVVVVFFIVYQQVENHFLQPVVYGRTVQLSPLMVLISVLIGAELAGILGALGAIPVAGAIQVLIVDWLRHRRERTVPAAPAVPQTGET